jgi:hypothetical protein
MDNEAGHVKTTPPQSEKSEGHQPDEGAQTTAANATEVKSDDKYERLLRESKSYKSEVQKLKADIANLTKASKQKETDWKVEYETLNKNWMKSSISGAVKAEAAKRGMHNPERALKLIGEGQLQFNSETGEVIGVEEFFDSLQTSDPYLFKARSAGVNGAAPGGSAPAKPKDAMENLQDKLRKTLGHQ